MAGGARRFILVIMPLIPALLLASMLLLWGGQAGGGMATGQAAGQVADPMQLGKSYYVQGDFQRARQQFEAAHAANPGDIRAAVLLATTYVKLNRSIEAANLLLPLEAGHESDSEFEYVLAFALMQSGKAADGLPRMEKVAQATRNANAFVVAATARMARGEFHEARPDIEAALAINPKIAGIYTMVGQARYATDDADGAIDAYEAALRANPRDFLANLYLGTIRLNQTDLKDARPMLELALQLEPKAPLARLGMAKIYIHTEQYAQALEPLESLVAEAPDWVEPRWMLADVYFKLNRPQDGAKQREIIQQIKEKLRKMTPTAPEK